MASFAPEFTEASLLSGRRQHAMLLLAAARACLSSPAPPPRPQTRAAPLSPLHRRRSTATLPRPARIPLLRPLGATAGAGASSRPARDRVIEFGKHKGQMLGTLPPSYLRWVVADLDYGDTLVWAREVLDDPVYVDRVEWQHAHSFLRGDSKFDYVYDDGDGPLQEMAERFGWDLSDEDGWAASTSASSAPPMVAASRGRPTGARAPAAAATDPPAAADPDGPRGKRDERRERTRTRREEQVRTAKLDVLGAKDGHGGIWFVGPTGQICA